MCYVKTQYSVPTFICNITEAFMAFSKKDREEFQIKLAKQHQLVEIIGKEYQKNLEFFEDDQKSKDGLLTLCALAKDFSEGILNFYEHLRSSLHEENEDNAEENAAEEWLAKQPLLQVDTSTQTAQTPVTPKLNLQNLQTKMSTLKPAKPTASFHEQQFEEALKNLRQALCWQKAYAEKDARQELVKLEKYIDPERMQTEIKIVERRGATYINFENRLTKLLKQCSPIDDAVLSFWQEIKEKHGWFITKFIKIISYKSQAVCTKMIHTHSKEQVLNFIEKLKQHYGKGIQDCIKNLHEIINAYANNDNADQEALQGIIAGSEHRIQCLEPETAWVLYIDESGSDFNKDHGTAQVTGVLFPANSPLRTLGKNVHCTEMPKPKVLRIFNELLDSKCAILGLNKHELHTMSQEEWFASVLELILWVWRLLPLRVEGNTSLRVCIEEHSQFKPEQDTNMLKKAFDVQADKEDSARCKRIDVTEITFVTKGTGHLGWADVAAYMWGSPSDIIKKGLQKSGLKGKCYLENVSDLLPVWAKALSAHTVLTGAEWLKLMQEKTQKGSITEKALKNLQNTCLKDKNLWQIYMETTKTYLLGKDYNLETIEKICAWLGQINSDDLPKEQQFFLKMSELATNNHQGDITDKPQKLRAEIQELAESVGESDLGAKCHAALRIAVSYANAFDFAKARQCLAPWDSLHGGNSMGSALWDGKILSSLGQYAAFEGDYSKALSYFDAALIQFEKLQTLDVADWKKQCEQTAVYAAIVAMDMENMPDTERVQRLERALGGSIHAACIKFSKPNVLDDRYVHHMLVRYLATYGTDDEKILYSKNSQYWHIEEHGTGKGHPWPLIQWYRWYMLPENMQEAKKKIMSSLFTYCWGNTSGATVDLIGITLGLSADVLAPTNSSVQERLVELANLMPYAVKKMQFLLDGQETGLSLVKKVLPFNYR